MKKVRVRNYHRYRMWGIKYLILKLLPPHEFGEDSNAEELWNRVNDIGQSKVCYTEGQVKKAIELAREQESDYLPRTDSVQYSFKNSPESILQSIQPKLVVEMKEVEYGHVDDYSKPHGFKREPLTYQKDGKTYLKLI